MRLTMRSRLSRSFVVLGRVDIVSFESGPVMRRKVDGCWSMVDGERRESAAIPERLTTTDFLLATRCRLRHSSFLDSSFEMCTLKNSFHKYAWCIHQVRIQFARFDQVLDFSDCDLGRGRHHRIKIARGFAVDEVTPSVALPGLDEGEVGFQRALHDVSAPVELARFFAVSDQCSDASGRKKCGNASAPGAYSLGKRSLGNEVEFHSAIQHHLLEQFVFANVSSDVPPDLAIREEQSHGEAIDAGIVADGG